ncbi:hypothetical protein BKA62DRAFT_213139 [Auriculariales sp. MPI-PUGE-AT-0066]|nr:hypothetical protein BKA62DRAFT_213139 [Auriculariales sp. MPI-PUGE-AT-0066]
MDATTVGRLFARRPPLAAISATTVTSYLALSTNPSFVPVVLVLSCILVAAHDAALTSNDNTSAIILIHWLAVSVGGTLARLGPSWSALSTPWASLALSFVGIALHAAIAIGAARLSWWMASPALHLPSWTQLVAFPAIWTVIEMGLSQTPVGRLLTWTPMSGYHAYTWTLPFVGVSAIDWLAGAWAVALSHGLIASQDVNEPYSDEDDADDRAGHVQKSSSSKHLPLLVVLLAVLAAPLYVYSPSHAVDYGAEATLVPVACILPPASDATALSRYLDESKKFVSTARLLVWPEAAVTVSTREEKDHLFHQVRGILNSQHYTWVAVSYLERVSGMEKFKNTLSILSHDAILDFNYTKQHLVPLVESYHQISSNVQPSVVDLPLEVHRGKHHILHNVSISASICLDFASPLTFQNRTKPAIVLGPASTWHSQIGEAMVAQARARALEIGSHIIWCDGGAGGQSGVLSPYGDDSEFIQPRHDGSWVKTIAVSYPFEEPRTWYSALGNFLALAVLCILIPTAGGGSAFLLQRGTGASKVAGGWATSAKDALMARLRGRAANERTPLLIDF